jgi:hypothetical protein
LVRFGSGLLAWLAALLVVCLLAAMTPTDAAEKEGAAGHA